MHHHAPHVNINSPNPFYTLATVLVETILAFSPHLLPPVGEILVVFRCLGNEADLVEEPDDHMENNIDGGNHEEQGGKQDDPQLEHEITYHC